MRIVICDDDLNVVDEIDKYITQFFDKMKIDLPSIHKVYSGEELLGDKEKKDIIFLDVEMPGASGILVGKVLKKENPDAIIIIVTSYNEYLDDAMRFEVFRYLSKPLDKHRLFRNLRDAIKKFEKIDERIVIETRDGVYTMRTRDIVYLEVQTRKKLLFTKDKVYAVTQPLEYWKEHLDKGCFFQSHRNYTVNLKYVSEFDRDSITLCNGKYKVFLTRRKYREFKDAYLLYLEGTR